MAAERVQGSYPERTALSAACLAFEFPPPLIRLIQHENPIQIMQLAHFERKIVGTCETNVTVDVDSNRCWRWKLLHAWIMPGIVTQLCGDFGRRESDLVFGESGHGGRGRAAVGLTN